MRDNLISREDLLHLAELARIRLSPQEEEKLLKDLQDILGHFEELKEIDTSLVTPINGGTYLKNIFRDDSYPLGSRQGLGRESFPKEQGGFLKVPPVFKKSEGDI